jgi:hypothetical protein
MTLGYDMIQSTMARRVGRCMVDMNDMLYAHVRVLPAC